MTAKLMIVGTSPNAPVWSFGFGSVFAYIKQKFACVKKLLCKLDTSMKYIWNIWKKGNAYEAQYYYFVV